MKKLYYLIILTVILGLVLTGCSLLSNVGQVPATEQSGIPYLPKGMPFPIAANLVALWHFDENSGTTAYDSTENYNDGTIYGAPSWVDGKLGKALIFDGNDYVIVPDSSFLEPDRITVEAWVKKSGTPGSYRYIVSKYLPAHSGSYSSYGLYTASTGGLIFYIGLSSSSTWVASPDAGTGVWDGNWHHVAGTYDGSAVKLYVDGDPVAGAGSTTSDIDYEGTGNLFIGAYTTASYCFSGTIDEVRIWDEALTAEEIWYSYADETLHVDDDWAQWPGAYYTINEALAVAGDGDTIIVHEGKYINDIWDGSSYRIEKSVTLLGAQAGVDPAGSTDRGGESILERTNGLPYSLYASDITINGFMFGSSSPNTGGRLIISDVADNAIIRNCIIQNTPITTSGHGVYIYPGADNALVEYNTFYNTAWEAIASTGASNATISHNYISLSGQHAIQMMGHAGSNNEITYNHISGITDKNAIQYWGGPVANISYNVINGGNTMYDGIWLDSAADGSTVSYNQISDTVYAGINVRGGCTGSTVTYNELSGCGTGIETHVGATGASVNYNSIVGNSWGVRNYDTETLNATCNWWGDNSGPSSVGPGTGDAVSSNVDFDPWLGDIVFEPITIIPVALTTETELIAFFTGPTEGTATINWGDQNSGDGTVDDDNGTVTGYHTYTSTGVYTVTVTLTITNECIPNPIPAIEVQFAVVYDSSEGFVTGGGWIDSPAGAYTANSSLTGKATFGFVSKYKKGATVPTGNTEFQFKAGDLNFHSDSYEWLVIAGKKAMYKGTGTINGDGEYGFMLFATDSDPDLFRIKIHDKINDDGVIYDNKPGTEDGTELGGGQIIVHKGK